MIVAVIFVLAFILAALNAKKVVTGFLLAIGISIIFEIYVFLMIAIYILFLFFDRIEPRASMSANS